MNFQTQSFGPVAPGRPWNLVVTWKNFGDPSGSSERCQSWHPFQPPPPVPLCQCQSTFHEQAKSHRLDISAGSQKGSFMGHYGVEQRAVYKAIIAGAQGVV